jgi:UDP-N-acetylglucosamine enolpyruvyl transferase
MSFIGDYMQAVGQTYTQSNYAANATKRQAEIGQIYLNGSALDATALEKAKLLTTGKTYLENVTKETIVLNICVI